MLVHPFSSLHLTQQPDHFCGAILPSVSAWPSEPSDHDADVTQPVYPGEVVTGSHGLYAGGNGTLIDVLAWCSPLLPLLPFHPLTEQSDS